jgi:hypothetical protein
MLLVIEGFWAREADRFSAAHCQSSSVDRIADFLVAVFIYVEMMVQ